MPNEPLAGKTAIVTGASSGIGLAAANMFFDRGARVHAVARREDAMKKGAGEERLSGSRFTAHAVDVTDRGAVEEHERGVRFSTVLPGVVDTPILDNRPEPPPKEVRDQALRPEDVADVCLFLVTLPPRAHIPELTILPNALQALGNT